MSTFYLTTPLYYPNARPHVGSAYTTIVCDVITRYRRMCGYDVAFLTGTDEHGEKLARAAAAAGKSPSEFVAEQRELFKTLWKKLGIEYDYFVYTDRPDHVTSVQRMLGLAQKNKVDGQDIIFKRRYEGRYCIFDERYVSDSTDPVDCDICGRPAELISEDNYFFKLSAFQDRLLDHYRNHPEFVQPDFRRNEVVSLVKSGLRDISISRRRIKWGVPWPGDPEQVFYVWYDALIGYLTGIGYAQGEQGNATFQKYWVTYPVGEIMHMIGKDILRQHAVYWPAFLMAAGLPLPKTVFAHGYINYEQDKMSKSKGNVVYPEPIVEALDSFGAPGNDALRYYLLRDTPFGQDTSFSYEALIQRYNSDLANDLGNLANRTVNMIQQYAGGMVPAPLGDEALGQLSSELLESLGAHLHDIRPHDQNLLSHRVSTFRATIDGDVQAFELCFEKYLFAEGLQALWRSVSEANKLIVLTQPWTIAKSRVPVDQDAVKTILFVLADALRLLAARLCPVVPSAAEHLWQQLGCEGNIEDQKFSDLKWGGLKPGTKVGKPEPIFPRLDKAATLAKLHELAAADLKRSQPKGATVTVPSEEQSAIGSQQSAESNPQSPIANRQSPIPKITIDDFSKVDLRVGQILSAEAIPGAKKLLKLMVDIGSEVRQVAAGIAEYYQPEQLVGMKVVLVANLGPRKLRGVESNGMVVAASVGPEGKPVLATFKEDVPNGARLK